MADTSEPKSAIERYQQIHAIAHAEIPIPKISPAYSLFEYRKEICKRFVTGGVFKKETQQNYLDLLNHTEDQIKKYLMLQ